MHYGGSSDQPLIIRGAELGKVVLTAAEKNLREGKAKWKLEQAELALYSTAFTHNPARVLYSNLDLMPYPRLESLKTFMLKDGYPGAFAGFYYSAKEKKLYVRLNKAFGDTDPAKHVIAAGAINAGGYNGQHVWKPEHANLFIDSSTKGNVIVDGLSFETPGAAGVLTRAGNVIVRNALFYGCRFGVFGVKVDNIIIENSFYTQAPAFTEMQQVIEKYRGTEVEKMFPIFWWHRKGKGNDHNVMKNYETGIAGGVARDWLIRSNHVKNSFEALSCWCNSDSVNLQVYGNVFEQLIDNALETENHAKNMRIYNNVFKDIFEPISWQPLGGKPWPGPIFVYGNIFYTSKFAQKLWPWEAGCFKIGVSGSNWQHPEMGGITIEQLRSRISKRFVAVDDPGFMIFNNTIYYPHDNLLTTPQPIVGKARRDLINFCFFNNIIVTRDFHKRADYIGDTIEFYNNLVYCNGNAERGKIIAGMDGVNAKSLTGLGLVDMAGGDFALKPSSPAIKLGTLELGELAASTDAGAIRYGSTWKIPATYPAQSSNKPSVFDAAVYARTDLNRLPAPQSGRFGVYSQDNAKQITLGYDFSDISKATLGVWLYLQKPENGAKDKSVELLTVDGVGQIVVNRGSKSTGITWNWLTTPAGKAITVDLPLQQSGWHHVQVAWDVERSVAGMKVGDKVQRETLPATTGLKSIDHPAVTITLHDIAIYDLKLTDTYKE